MRVLLSLLAVLAIYFVSDAVNSENSQRTKKVTNAATPLAISLTTDPRKTEPLKEGQALPDVEVKNLQSKVIQLKELVSKKPTVIVFYRGGWCPYCNTQLSDLQKIEKRILAKGYQLVAISPDLPSELKKTSDKVKMNYKLMSDSEMQVIQAFGIAFKTNDKESSRPNHNMLPVPSVFVVNVQGEIQYQYSNADYKVRLQGGEMLAALDRLNKLKKSGHFL